MQPGFWHLFCDIEVVYLDGCDSVTSVAEKEFYSLDTLLDYLYHHLHVIQWFYPDPDTERCHKSDSAYSFLINHVSEAMRNVATIDYLKYHGNIKITKSAYLNHLSEIDRRLRILFAYLAKSRVKNVNKVHTTDDASRAQTALDKSWFQ